MDIQFEKLKQIIISKNIYHHNSTADILRKQKLYKNNS